jgi:thiamine-monophosphate kinase
MVLALPNHVSVQMVEELMAGFDRIALAEDVIISHTDVTASHSHLGIAASMSFRRDETAMRPDQGPHAGDLICVSGDLGGAFAGLRILLREKRAWLQHDPSGHAPFQPDLSDYAEVVGRQLSPVPRTDVIRDLRRAKIHPGAIWIVKNGLYNDLQQLAEHLGVGAEIHASAIPIALTTRDVADELQEDVDRYALLGGEDYELLFTVKEVEAEQLLQEVDDVAVIGRVLEAEQGVVVHTQE